MIRKFLLSTAAIAAVSTSAFAADLPSRRAPPVYVPPPVPLFSWTGFYIGAQAGAAFGLDKAREVPVGFAAPDAIYNVGTPTGTIAGIHLGYNVSTSSIPVLGQLAGGLSGIPFIGQFGGVNGVAGIEGDVDGTDYRSTQTFGAFNQTARQQVVGTARGRLGVAVDRALFYVTGGAAFGQFRETYSLYNLNGSTAFSESASASRVGYTVGGGLEYAITTQFSLRGEYRYTDYGTIYNVNTIGNNVFGGGFNTTHHLYQNRVQVGFSYKFGEPPVAPVVARY